MGAKRIREEGPGREGDPDREGDPGREGDPEARGFTSERLGCRHCRLSESTQEQRAG